MGCEYFGAVEYDDPELASIIRDWIRSCEAEGRWPRAVPTNTMYILYCCDRDCFPPRQAKGVGLLLAGKYVQELIRRKTISLNGNAILITLGTGMKPKPKSKKKSVKTRKKLSKKR